jgi:hypothetical protein
MKGRPDSYLIILYPATNVKSTPQIDAVLTRGKKRREFGLILALEKNAPWKKRDVANRGYVAFKAAVMLY